MLGLQASSRHLRALFADRYFEYVSSGVNIYVVFGSIVGVAVDFHFEILRCPPNPATRKRLAGFATEPYNR
jgi:hypothetical protein